MRGYGISLVCAETAVAFRDKCGLLLIARAVLKLTREHLSYQPVPLHDYVLRKADKGDCMQAYKSMECLMLRTSISDENRCHQSLRIVQLRMGKVLGASVATHQAAFSS
jgi:hypothetical protein